MPSHRRLRLAQFFGEKLHTQREVDKAGLGRLRPLRLEICKTLVAHSETGEARRESCYSVRGYRTDASLGPYSPVVTISKPSPPPPSHTTEQMACFRETINMTVFCFALICGERGIILLFGDCFGGKTVYIN